jgi:hypothetical protein
MIIGARTHLQNQKDGCKQLLELYKSLNIIFEDSVALEREMSKIISEERNYKRVYLGLKALSDHTHDFTAKLHKIRYEMEIFDLSLIRDIGKFLGFKYFLLHYACSHTNLVSDKDKKKILVSIKIDEKKIRELKGYPLLEGYFFYCPITGCYLEPPKGHQRREDEPVDLVKNEYIPFDDKIKVEEILIGFRQNIEQLRTALERLAAYIKDNCKYSELK